MQRCTAVAAVMIACGSSGPPPAPPPVPVPVITLAPGEIVESTEYLAQLRSRTAAAIKPQVEGVLTGIFVKPGDVVNAGSVLMRIDPSRQSAAVAQTQASLASRQAARDLAERNLSRVEELVRRGALPQQELDNARTAAETARADLAALAAQLRGSRVQLGYYQVTAPTHGVVGDIPVRVGDTVTPATQVTSVADISVLEANVAVPVDRARDVKLGTELRVLGPAGDRIATGRVTFVAPEVDAAAQSVLVKADIQNPDGALRADQVVRALIVWRVRTGLAVPALAVTWTGGQAFVFVADASGGRTIARQRAVKLGEPDARSYPVMSGLTAGERVVTGAIQKLRDGVPITPEAPAPAPPPAGSAAPAPPPAGSAAPAPPPAGSAAAAGRS